MNIPIVCMAGFLSVVFAGVAFGGESECITCHGDIGKGAFLHTPVASGECSSCHESTGKKHPDNKNSLRLAADGVKLCLMCHDDLSGKKYSHAPATGDCTMCHDPHQSKSRYQLKDTGSSLCFSCHDASSYGGASVHEPVVVGQCTACHSPHGSDNPRMLLEPFPNELYLPYVKDAYSLCFLCHKEEIALDRRSVLQTGFRDGDRNLHYVHVNNPSKGRSCKACHSPHASKQLKLIREKVTAFGKWDIPFRYEKTTTGGTCFVGCHKPQSYEREAPVPSAQ